MDKEKEQQPQQPTGDTTAAAGTNTGKPGDEFQDEFYNSGRIGRRNAMPDILGSNSTASSGGDLPLKLSALSTNGESQTVQMSCNCCAFTSRLNEGSRLMRSRNS